MRSKASVSFLSCLELKKLRQTSLPSQSPLGRKRQDERHSPDHAGLVTTIIAEDVAVRLIVPTQL